MLFNCYIVALIIFSLLLGWVSTTGAKTQFVRLIDVFVYGPFLIYTSTLVDNVLIKSGLIIMGGTTISYNLKNYLFEEQQNA